MLHPSCFWQPRNGVVGAVAHPLQQPFERSVPIVKEENAPVIYRFLEHVSKLDLILLLGDNYTFYKLIGEAL